MMRYQSRLAARMRQISSKKSLPMDQKKASRSPIQSASCPRPIMVSMVSIPLAMATATSVMAEVPNSRRLYPLMVMKFHRGTSRQLPLWVHTNRGADWDCLKGYAGVERRE